MGRGRNRTEGDDFVSARLNKQRDISYKRILNTLFDLASEINYFNSHNPVVSLRVIAYAPVVGRHPGNSERRQNIHLWLSSLL